LQSYVVHNSPIPNLSRPSTLLCFNKLSCLGTKAYFLYVRCDFFVHVVNILAIGAHPEDIELGCGGTLLKTARQGHNIYLYTLTQGRAAGQVIRRGF
jgi:hypothetical protein